MLGINKYAFWGIIVISITLLIIVILIVSVVKYNIKQKYNSINQHIFSNLSYKEKLNHYNNILEEAGVTSKREKKKLLKIIEALIT